MDYRLLKEVFAALFGTSQGALDARLKHAGRLGLPIDKPGKGQRRIYHDEQVAKIFLLLTFESMKLDPMIAVKLVVDHWSPPAKKTRDPIKAAHRGEASLAELVIAARAATKRAEHIIVTIDFSSIPGEPTIGYTWASEKGTTSLGAFLAGHGHEPADRLVAIFDLTAKLKKLDAAIAAAQAPKPVLSPLAAAIIASARKARGEA
jgi:hypothetical protein